VTVEELKNQLDKCEDDAVVILSDGNGWSNIDFDAEIVAIIPSCNIVFSDDKAKSQ